MPGPGAGSTVLSTPRRERGFCGEPSVPERGTALSLYVYQLPQCSWSPFHQTSPSCRQQEAAGAAGPPQPRPPPLPGPQPRPPPPTPPGPPAHSCPFFSV